MGGQSGSEVKVGQRSKWVGPKCVCVAKVCVCGLSVCRGQVGV